MGYLDINNLYKDKSILLFRECYAMEKIHGTSAHIKYKDEKIIYFSGGEKYDNFVKIFDSEKLLEGFKKIGQSDITIYGEAYGGKCQGMSNTYGKELKFVAFDVEINDCWLSVPQTEEIVLSLGLEFVHYDKVPTDIEILDELCNSPSVQAQRNGMGSDKLREGIVLRPLIEVKKNNGERIIAKHKNDTFSELSYQPRLTQKGLETLTEIDKIVDQWVTEMRLTHILDSIPEYSIEKTGDVIRAMVNDIYKESEGEIVESRELKTAIGKRTAQMFKQRLNKLT